MVTEIASSNLATLSYRISNEPNFAPKLLDMIEARKLDSGQPISEEDAVLLKSYLDQDLTPSQTHNVWTEGVPGELETWVA